MSTIKIPPYSFNEIRDILNETLVILNSGKITLKTAKEVNKSIRSILREIKAQLQQIEIYRSSQDDVLNLMLLNEIAESDKNDKSDRLI